MSEPSPPPVSVVRAEDLVAEPEPVTRIERGIPRRRQLAGVVLLLTGLPLLTLALAQARGDLALSSIVLLFLLAVVVLALVGGVVVGVGSALVAAWLINYFFIHPLHTLDIAQRDEEIALAVFVAVGTAVSVLVEVAGRRSRLASRATAQVETLTALAGRPADGEESLPALLERARVTLGMESVGLKAREPGSDAWTLIEHAGPELAEPAPLRFDLAAGPRLRLVGRGPALFAQDQRVLRAFAAAAQAAHESARLSEEVREARTLGQVDRQRTALLAAVGHDLRTPLSTIKAAASSLRQTEVGWSEVEREDLLATIEAATDRLDSVVANLLDASRLQAGVLTVHPTPVALDEVVGAAILAVPEAAARVEVAVAEDLPLVLADPGLLERVLANVIDNALRHGAGQPVSVTAEATSTTARVAIVDHGPGVPAQQREALFAPFQRLGDRSGDPGVGLGLAVARGFTEAMGGAIVADGSDGSGLTIRLRLPLAGAPATDGEDP